MSETDIRTKFITPAIQKAGWDIYNNMREEYIFTDGRIIVKKNKTKRGAKKKVDYILYHKSNLPIAIIEAKDNNHTIASGIQQGLDYQEGLKKAKQLDVPFIYSSNGDGFLEHDMFTGFQKELTLEEFPSPEELWRRYRSAKGINEEQEKIITQNYFFKQGAKTPRYYQRVAINRVVEAISKGRKRLLLVMATGTGKTYTAFQIMYRLLSSKAKKRILFLADRNVLVDQTMADDFRDFDGKMIKISRGNISKAHEIYLGLYQSMTGGEEWQQTFKEYSRDFFDLIIVDECHRGTARENSAWREVLDYFHSATHLGMTATPKIEKGASNIEYFGDPIYTYSLKQGIEDGFLAPYKVVRIGLDKDLMGFRPEKGQVDKYGNLIEDREYDVSDFDKNMVLEKRTKLVAEIITEFLKKTDRFAKTIVFCIDINHAERMAFELGNCNSDLVRENNKYVMKITGDDQIGKAQLENFTAVDSKYPVIATTSKLLTTGVDTKMCKLIVLDSNISSITEFKQIIGRGTRVREEEGKTFFTIMDFRRVTRLFADSEFDGDPVEEDTIIVGEDPKGCFDDRYEEGDSVEDIIEDVSEPFDENGDEQIRVKKIKYYLNNVEVKLINERVQYLDQNGKLISESLIDYSKKNLQKQFIDLNNFINKWNSEDKKQVILNELEEQGVFLDELRDKVGKDFDEFDLICHVAFDANPLTKQERVNNVKKRNYFTKYGEQAKKVIDILLEKYRTRGVVDIEDINILRLEEFKTVASPQRIVQMFGGKNAYLEVISDLKKQLYMDNKI